MRQLHKAEQPWILENISESDESYDAKKELLLRKVRLIFNIVTPTTRRSFTKEFLGLRVYQLPNPLLTEVVSIILDKAVQEPKYCELYALICYKQAKDEEKRTGCNVSSFINSVLSRAQESFSLRHINRIIKDKKVEMDAESCEKMIEEKRIELVDAQSKFRRRKFGNIMFIGHLFLQRIVSMNVVHFCIVDLLSSVAIDKDGHRTYSDVFEEESVECAVLLLEKCGKQLHEESKRAVKAAEAAAESPTPSRKQPFPFNKTFSTFSGAMPIVSSRIRFMILNLMQLRVNRWVPIKVADKGPKKLSEISNDIRREQTDKLNAMEALIEKMENKYEESENMIHWRDKYDELAVEKDEIEKKYRKLLMMVARGNENGQ